MKNKFPVMMMLFVVILFFTFQKDALAGRGCNAPDFDVYENFSVDKNAPGSKFDSVLTIFYADAESACAASYMTNNWTDMHFFMRLEGNVESSIAGGQSHSFTGKDLYAFGGVAECVPWWSDLMNGIIEDDAFTAQKQAIEEFFRIVANPYIYTLNHPEDPDGCDPSSSDPALMCPNFAVKDVSKIVEDMGGDTSGGLRFMILDLVIAIED